MSNLTFWHNSQWITLLTHSCQVLYSFCTNLLHSRFMLLIVSSLSYTILLRLFYCCFRIALVYCCFRIVLMPFFCTAHRRNTVYFLNVAFLNQIQVFSCEILFFVAWNVYTVDFHPLFVFCLFLLASCLCWQYCNQTVTRFTRSFLCSILISVSKLSWMLASPLPLSFLAIYSLPKSTLGIIPPSDFSQQR